MEKENIKKIFKKNVEIFDNAWDEFFKNKLKPKTDEEDIEQQKEFAKYLKEKYGLDLEFRED